MTDHNPSCPSCPPPPGVVITQSVPLEEAAACSWRLSGVRCEAPSGETQLYQYNGTVPANAPVQLYKLVSGARWWRIPKLCCCTHSAAQHTPRLLTTHSVVWSRSVARPGFVSVGVCVLQSTMISHTIVGMAPPRCVMDWTMLGPAAVCAPSSQQVSTATQLSGSPPARQWVTGHATGTRLQHASHRCVPSGTDWPGVSGSNFCDQARL